MWSQGFGGVGVARVKCEQRFLGGGTGPKMANVMADSGGLTMPHFLLGFLTAGRAGTGCRQRGGAAQLLWRGGGWGKLAPTLLWAVARAEGWSQGGPSCTVGEMEAWGLKKWPGRGQGL